MSTNLNGTKIRVTHKAEEEAEVAGHLRYEEASILSVPVNGTGTVELTWPYDVDVLLGYMTKVEDNNGLSVSTKGDKFASYSSIVVGTVTQAGAVGDTTVYLSTPVTVDVGDVIKIGGNLMEVKKQNQDSIEFWSGLTESVAVDDPVEMRRYFVGRPGAHILLGGSTTGMVFGRDTLDSSRLAAGVKLVIEFNNNSTTIVKDVMGMVAVLY